MRTGPVELVAVVGLYVLMSLVTFAAYGRDKRAAVRGTRRTPERTLQLMALCFGWPGAWLGRRVFHHKTLKRGFTAVFWVIGVVHAGAWVVVIALVAR
jgi:uncharacterized membrane protein YsdA (DUF1294 family)